MYHHLTFFWILKVHKQMLDDIFERAPFAIGMEETTQHIDDTSSHFEDDKNVDEGPRAEHTQFRHEAVPLILRKLEGLGASGAVLGTQTVP